MTIISIEIKVNINKGKNGVEHMILKIAIADKNSEYIRRILNVLETYGDIDVSVFTDEKSLKGALDQAQHLHGIHPLILYLQSDYFH